MTTRWTITIDVHAPSFKDREWELDDELTGATPLLEEVMSMAFTSATLTPIAVRIPYGDEPRPMINRKYKQTK